MLLVDFTGLPCLLHPSRILSSTEVYWPMLHQGECEARCLGHRDLYTYVLFQMICLKTGDEEMVLGLHLTGPSAGEVAQGFSVAMR